MGGYIYCIINDAVSPQMGYVGQTTRSIADRWNAHIYSSNHSDQLLYRAMRKYLLTSFRIRQCEFVWNSANLDEREKWWIDYLGTWYPNGYNMTLGGGGKGNKRNPIDERNYHLIVSLYTRGHTIAEIADLYNVNSGVISSILRYLNVNTQSRLSRRKPILQYSLRGSLLKEFDSVSDVVSELGLPASELYSACRSMSTLNHFRWCYKEDQELFEKILPLKLQEEGFG